MHGRALRAFVALTLVFSQTAYAGVGGAWLGGGRNALLFGYAQPVPAGGCFPSTNATLTLDPSDLTTIYTDVAGTTNVTADGDPVGMWKDKNGNGFNLTAAADDTTRPTYHTSAGLHWVTFDGTNDILWRAADLGIGTGAMTIAVAVRHDAAAQGSIVAAAKSGDTSEYLPLRNHGTDFNDIQAWERATTGIYSLNNVQIADEGFPTTTDVAVVVTDSGTSIQATVDGTAQTAQSHSSMTPTVNLFAVGGRRNATSGDFYGGRLSYLKVYSDAKDSGTVAIIDICLKATQGR